MVEGFAGVGKFLKQGRRRPIQIAITFTIFKHCIANIFQPDSIGIPHWPTAIAPHAVTIGIDDIDIARPEGYPLFQYQRPLIDHRIEQALDDFLI